MLAHLCWTWLQREEGGGWQRCGMDGC
jgi:hypothetical protein